MVSSAGVAIAGGGLVEILLPLAFALFGLAWLATMTDARL